MLNEIEALIYDLTPAELEAVTPRVVSSAQDLARRAFGEGDRSARLDAHRILYTIYLAGLAQPWNGVPRNIASPGVATVRHVLQRACDVSEELFIAPYLDSLPSASGFAAWIIALVRRHRAYEVHPIFFHMQQHATKEQLREFLFQETPLEMLFGDIVAMMLPGTYGAIKVELVRNFWDEVGQSVDSRVHRNLRARLMKYAGIAEDAYCRSANEFILEELALVNMYLSMVFDRSKLTQLLGVMLATELVIPGRFKFLIDGWRRLGADECTIEYLTEHVTVDEEHAQSWLNAVVTTVVAMNATAMRDVVVGVLRRLNNAVAVSDVLLERISQVKSGDHAMRAAS